MASAYLVLYRSMPSVLLLWLFTYLVSASASSLLEQDQHALLQIKASLVSLNSSVASHLADWVTFNGSDPCAWTRVACSNLSFSSGVRISRLDLSFLTIAGALSSISFSSLTALTVLNLSHNSFTGSITEDIANCTLLSTLDLSDNNFTSLHNLSTLSNLQSLSVAANNLSSNIPQVLPAQCAKLSVIYLQNNSIAGDLSSFPWQLCTSLQHLDLSNNQISGELPAALTNLVSIQQLILSNNELTGEIPASLCTSLSRLQYLDLSANRIRGSFPSFLTNCTLLEYLDLSSNNISGEIVIPQRLNWTSLQLINLSENKLHGAIPTELGSFINLRVLMAGSNALTGEIPQEIANCKSLYLLDLDTNLLQGNLPSFLNQMPSLLYLVLHSNAFFGEIPASLFAASHLAFLDLSNNSLSGRLPEQFSNLTSLTFLMLADNNFAGPIPTELGSLLRLQFLDLSSNHLSGLIPSSLGNLQDLLWLMLANNNLTGGIPRELGNCSSLLWLNLKSNSLSGGFSSELGTMGHNPNRIFTYNAQQYVDPPKALGECLMLKRWVPENYPPYSFVYDLLDRNRCKSFWIELLTGSPYARSACSQMSPRGGGYIQVTNNKLTGPLQISALEANQTTILLLALNSFSGNLPADLGKVPLFNLNLSHNMFNGPIPNSLGDNKCLTLLDLSFNNLSGSIPPSLGALTALTRFNVSYNPYLTGSIPQTGQFVTFSITSYTNNSFLCFETLPGMSTNFTTTIPFCNSSTLSVANPATPATDIHQVSPQVLLAIGMISSCFAVLLCCSIGFYIFWKRATLIDSTANAYFGRKHVDEEESEELHSTIRLFKDFAASDAPLSPPMRSQQLHPSNDNKYELTYSGILLATNNFDESHVIGYGGFGVVFKATLPDGSTVAIKKLAHYGSSSTGEKEFMTEMETLGTLAHENLVPLLACCLFGPEKLLVYKFICNGSLEDWLHEREEGAKALSWSRRMRIAWGCAKALRYLHHECDPVLIHRDMKASNILLDEQFQAYVADFGLARELDPASSHVSTMVAGTLGYVPPEYGQTCRATVKGDVYSFGVVMLELITGRKPLCFAEFQLQDDDSGDGTGCATNLVEWVRMLMTQSRASEAYDRSVMQSTQDAEAHLLEFVALACDCTNDLPDRRPTMKEVAQVLQAMVDSHR